MFSFEMLKILLPPTIRDARHQDKMANGLQLRLSNNEKDNVSLSSGVIQGRYQQPAPQGAGYDFSRMA
ncbi:MAG: hypothetical protein WCK03_02800 [Candidatus Taylorbacteria bacterium]